MPDRIRLQQRASAAVSQSHDLSIRAHGADSAPGEHTAAFRGVNGAGVEGLTGAHRALSHGVFSLDAGHGVAKCPSPEQGGHCVGKCDRGVMPDASPESGVNSAPRASSRIEQIGQIRLRMQHLDLDEVLQMAIEGQQPRFVDGLPRQFGDAAATPRRAGQRADVNHGDQRGVRRRGQK